MCAQRSVWGICKLFQFISSDKFLSCYIYRNNVRLKCASTHNPKVLRQVNDTWSFSLDNIHWLETTVCDKSLVITCHVIISLYMRCGDIFQSREIQFTTLELVRVTSRLAVKITWYDCKSFMQLFSLKGAERPTVWKRHDKYFTRRTSIYSKTSR